MSWLQPVQSTAENSSSDSFASRTVVVERDLHTEEMVTEVFQGYPCVCAYPDYELLERMHGGEEVDHVMLTGRELKRRMKGMPHVGIMYRPNLDEEVVIVWPEVAQVQRVSVE